MTLLTRHCVVLVGLMTLFNQMCHCLVLQLTHDTVYVSSMDPAVVMLHMRHSLPVDEIISIYSAK